MCTGRLVLDMTRERERVEGKKLENVIGQLRCVERVVVVKDHDVVE